MTKCVKNIKRNEEIFPSLDILGLGKIPISSPLYRLRDLQDFWALFLQILPFDGAREVPLVQLSPLFGARRGVTILICPSYGLWDLVDFWALLFLQIQPVGEAPRGARCYCFNFPFISSGTWKISGSELSVLFPLS